MTQRGVAQPFLLIFLIIIVIAGAGGVLLVRSQTQSGQSSSESAQRNEESKTENTASPSPKLTLEFSTPTPSPTIPPKRSVTISGFAYEDKNKDGEFNSADSKLQYMMFNIYDLYDPEFQIHTIHSDAEGNWAVTLDVRGGIKVEPTTWYGYRPLKTAREFPNSTDGVEFPFFAVAASGEGQIGKIGGNVYHDANQNGKRDPDEQSIFFYKFYLQDESGGYYTGVDGGGVNQDGHFEYHNLPINQTYKIRLSNPTGDYIINQSEFFVPLTSENPEKLDVQIPVYKVSS